MNAEGQQVVGTDAHGCADREGREEQSTCGLDGHPTSPGYVPGEVRIGRRKLDDLVATTSAGCWEWQGTIDSNGYGMVNTTRRHVKAHRHVYKLLVGPVPDDLVLDHLCRNRCCVNPAHLDPVTQRANLLRSPLTLAFQNATKTHCKHGHEFTLANTRVRKDGKRQCRQCEKERVRHFQAFPMDGDE